MMRRDANLRAEELEFAAHAILATLHGLGAWYHLRRRKWLHGAAHGAAFVFDAVSAIRHMRAPHLPKADVDALRAKGVL